MFGLRHQKPRHYREMARAVWANRNEPPFAWRILRDGVCDGCALGTSGLSDWTVKGPHLCMVRLELLPLNTAPEMDVRVLADATALERLSSRELRELGRPPHPMMRRSGDAGFRMVSWERPSPVPTIPSIEKRTSGRGFRRPRALTHWGDGFGQTASRTFL
jgi:hypothetical protein